MPEFTHFDAQGNAHMVDVGHKDETAREAIATGIVEARPETLQRITEHGIGKGDVLGVARIAGIMAAKRTSEFIPLCHPLPLSSVGLEFRVEESHIFIQASVKTTGRTGVEMEALTAVSIAALTIYDMCKAIDRGMIIRDIQLVMKTGGKSGTFVR